MNRAKHPLTSKMQKKMAKEIHTAQGDYLAPEARQYRDELTAKEMLKKYPKKAGKKQKEGLNASKTKISIKKKSHPKIVSKRTTPGLVPSDSPPAHIHPEGKRWIKILTTQNLTERAIHTHKGNRGLTKKKGF